MAVLYDYQDGEVVMIQRKQCEIHSASISEANIEVASPESSLESIQQRHITLNIRSRSFADPKMQRSVISNPLFLAKRVFRACEDSTAAYYFLPWYLPAALAGEIPSMRYVGEAEYENCCKVAS